MAAMEHSAYKLKKIQKPDKHNSEYISKTKEDLQSSVPDQQPKCTGLFPPMFILLLLHKYSLRLLMNS